jgi:hypothetical protein
MVKNLITYSFVFTLVGVSSYFFHDSFIEKSNTTLPFSLKKVYIFFMLFSFVICSLSKIGSLINKIKEQLGFVYLSTIVLKIIIFAMVFYEPIFVTELNTDQRITLIIPMAISLFIEVFFVAKILNKTSF